MRRITYLECGEWAAAHALGGIPDAARLVAGLHRGEVAALAAADLLPVILNSEVIFGYHSQAVSRNIQRSAKVGAPGCVNAAGKLRQTFSLSLIPLFLLGFTAYILLYMHDPRQTTSSYKILCKPQAPPE